MATTNHTANYNLSQYAATDPVKFLTNYNQDMAAIDAALKSISDEAAAAVPNTRKIAGLALNADITLAQLVAAGLCPAPEQGSFTPYLFGATVTGTPSYTLQTGAYTKIAGLYILHHIGLVLSNLGGMQGDVFIGGLPFTSGEGFLFFNDTQGYTLSAGNVLYGGSISGTSARIHFTSSNVTTAISASALSDTFSFGAHGFAAA